MIVGTIGAAVVLFGVWSYNGYPNVLAMFTSQPAPAPGAPGVGLVDDTGATGTATSTWSCVYLPTENHNWHDDVECFDGTTRFQPELLPDDDMITEDEMRAAAADYENRLNNGEVPAIP